MIASPEKSWPVHLKPKAGELFTSWLARLSIAHGLKPNSFTSIIWPSNTNLWLIRDFDRANNKEGLELLAEKTCTTLEKVIVATLSDYQGRLYEISPPSGVTYWLLPRGQATSRNHNLKYFGLQYCPRCLSEEEPYFRREWRLAFVTFCAKHKLFLLDRCTRCGYAINFYMNVTREWDRVSDSLTVCYNCTFDLRHAPISTSSNSIATDTLNFQKHLLTALDQGWVEVPQNASVHSLMYFEGLRHLAYALSGRHRHIKNLLELACRHYGIKEGFPGPRRRTTFESLDVITRRIIVFLMSALLKDWSSEFIQFSRAYKIESDVWSHQQQDNIPYWYWSIIHLNLKRTRYLPTEQEVTAIFDFIERTGRPSTTSELLKYLNSGVAQTRRKRRGLTQAAKYAKHPEAIKQEAIRLLLEGKRSGEVKQILPVSSHSLWKWMKDYNKSADGGSKPT